MLKTEAVSRFAPFALTMLLALTASAVLSRTVFHALSDIWLQRLGFALKDLVPARFWRLPLSALVTPGALYFWFVAVAIVVLVGLCERLVGSWRAALAFWGVHVGTGLVEAIVGLSASGLWHPTLLHEVVGSRTVGPSAGYLACLGVAFAFCPRRQRKAFAYAAGAALTVSFDVRNAGKRKGKATAQVYATPPTPGSVARLIAWSKVDLKPGETRRITVPVDMRLLASFDTAANVWRVAAGDYVVTLGSSSADVGATANVHLDASTIKP